MGRSPIKWNYRHAEGHQDDKQPVQLLDIF